MSCFLECWISWSKLELRHLWLQQILYGCIRWWKMGQAMSLMEEVWDLEWSAYTGHQLGQVASELERLAGEAETSDHPYRREKAEELRWVSQVALQLKADWIQHLALIST